MTNSGTSFSIELTNWLIDEADFNHSKCQISLYYKYELDCSKLVVFSYVDVFVYWYTYYELGKLFLDTLVKIFHVNFLGYAHWFFYIIISQLKYHSIPVDKSIYATSVVAKYLYTTKI